MMKPSSRSFSSRDEFAKFYNAWQAGEGPSLDPSKRGFVIFGEDDFLRRELFRLLKSSLKPELEDFNMVSYSPENLSLETLESEIKTYPMMAAHRLIVLDVSSDKKTQAQALLSYLAEVELQDVWFLIHWEMEDFSHTALLGHPQWKAIECLTPYPSQLPIWLQQMAKRYQLSLTPEALAALQERLPMDLSLIDQEMRRLRDGVDQPLITAEVVERFIGYQWEEKIFSLLDRYLERHTQQTLRELEYFVRSGEVHPLQWIQLLARNLKQMKLLYEGEKLIRLAPWQQKKLQKQMALWSEEELIKGLLFLSQLEEEMKSVSFDEQEWFLNRWTEWTLQGLSAE